MSDLPLPRAVDKHKPGRPRVPNVYGVFYAVPSVCFWFVLAFLGVQERYALSLASSVLFGSTMGLFDDIANLRWRTKAILPLFAALPYIVLGPAGRTTVSTILTGSLDLGFLFLILLVPAMVTIVTNSYNQLGGLNGLESGTGLIILVGMTILSGDWILMSLPLVLLVVLTYLSFTGKAFLGNIGSFSIGLTLVVLSILDNLKLMLLISFIPFIANSILILFSNYFLHDRAKTFMDNEGRLYATRIRSLRTLLLTHKRMTEHQVVMAIYLLVAFSVLVAMLITVM